MVNLHFHCGTKDGDEIHARSSDVGSWETRSRTEIATIYSEFMESGSLGKWGNPTTTQEQDDYVEDPRNE